MCGLFNRPTPRPATPQIVPQNAGLEAARLADEETRARRRRSAAAAVLTSPRGIPAGTTRQLGTPA